MLPAKWFECLLNYNGYSSIIIIVIQDAFENELDNQLINQSIKTNQQTCIILSTPDSILVEKPTLFIYFIYLFMQIKKNKSKRNLNT